MLHGVVEDVCHVLHKMQQAVIHGACGRIRQPARAEAVGEQLREIDKACNDTSLGEGTAQGAGDLRIDPQCSKQSQNEGAAANHL